MYTELIGRFDKTINVWLAALENYRTGVLSVLDNSRYQQLVVLEICLNRAILAP